MRRLGILCACVAMSAAPASASELRAYTTADGDSVQIAGFPDVAPAYAEFFSRLPHGRELSSLKVRLVDPGEVPRLCGWTGVTACYVRRESTIIAPAPRLDGPLLAHEYGHHLAANRSGGAFDPIRVGPSHWASAARVCSRLRAGRIGRGYASDPAEAWADVYTRLIYPHLPWRFTRILRPTRAALAAAARDVAGVPIPVRSGAYRSRFRERGSDVRRIRLPVRNDGAVDVAVLAEAPMELEFRIAVGRHRSRWTRGPSKRVTICRAGSEPAVVTVRRRAGSGPFTLRASYPG